MPALSFMSLALSGDDRNINIDTCRLFMFIFHPRIISCRIPLTLVTSYRRSWPARSEIYCPRSALIRRNRKASPGYLKTENCNINVLFSTHRGRKMHFVRVEVSHKAEQQLNGYVHPRRANGVQFRPEEKEERKRDENEHRKSSYTIPND